MPTAFECSVPGSIWEVDTAKELKAVRAEADTYKSLNENESEDPPGILPCVQ